MLVYAFEKTEKTTNDHAIQAVFSSEENAWNIIEKCVNGLYKLYGINNMVSITIGFRFVHVNYINTERKLDWIRYDIQCFNLDAELLNTVYITKTRDDAIIPEYAHIGDSGADLYSIETVTIEPLERKLMKTGIAMQIPFGYEACIRPRSGNALNFGYTVLNTPGTIDSNYRGEIGVIIYNASNEPVHIKKYDRIAQIVFQKLPQLKLVQVDELNNESDRGINGFGSTGQ